MATSPKAADAAGGSNSESPSTRVDRDPRVEPLAGLGSEATNGGSNPVSPAGYDEQGRKRGPLKKLRQMGELIKMWASLIKMEKGAPAGLEPELTRQRQRAESLVRDAYERLKAQPMVLKELSRERLRQLRQLQHGVKKQMRRVVTGAADKRIRDFVREKRTEPPVARWLDQISFTVGVLVIVFSEFVLLHAPELFYVWYVVLMTIMLGMRTYEYHKVKWQYFLIDFCYFANLCCFLQTFFAPRSCLATKVNFIFSHGPLCFAVLAWRNSLVFHDVDKMTTVYIHIAPSWLVYAQRWFGHRYLPGMGDMTAGQYAYQLLAFFLNPNAEFGSASSLSFAGRPRPEPVTASAAAASWMRSSAAAFFAVAKPVALQLLRLLRAALCAATAFLAEALPGGYVPEGAVSKVCSAGGQELASEPPVVAADSSTRIARAAMGAASRFYNKINLQELLYGGQTSDDSEDVAVFRCSAKDLAFTQADVGIIIGLYVLWQFLYYVKTEVLDAPLLDADPAISTSLRWISADRKHPMNKLFDFLMKKIGVMRKDEHFDSKTIKTKVIFIVGQLVYTVLTMAPVAIFINWWGGDIAFLTLIFCVTVYNAGGFYMQIFSKRYESGLEKKHLETRAQVAKELRESQGGADDANSVTSSSAASTSSVMDDLSNWEEANGSGNGNVAAADAASPSAPKKSTSKRKRRSRRGNSAASSEKSTPPTTDDDNAYESDMLSDYEDFEEFKSAVYDDENVALRTAALLDPSTPLSKG